MSKSEPWQLFCRGNSSLPLIADGSILTVEKASVEYLKPGEFIVFNGVGGPTCHRILKKRNGPSGVGLLMKGDGQLAADGWIDSSQVVAKVIAIDGTSCSHLSFRLRSTLVYLLSLSAHYAHRGLLMSPAVHRVRQVQKFLFPGVRGLGYQTLERVLVPWRKHPGKKAVGTR